MNEGILYKLEKAILIFIFSLSIYTPFFIGIIQDDKIVSSVEKRNLAKYPLLPESLKEFSEYPESFNTYYSDHFGYREVLTKVYFYFANKLGSRTSVDDVTIGQDGWLFLGSIKPGYQGYNDPIGDAININLFTKNELKYFARSLVTVKNWLSEKGIEYVFVIAPNKHTIYFENLPKYITKQNNKSATDQLVEYLQEYTDVVVVDLRQSLLDEKRKYQVYFKTDTHWNQYGANVAQFEIMKKIEPLFPERIMPFLLDNNQFKISARGGGDLAGFAKIENIKEDNPQPIFEAGCTPVNETPDSKARETYTMVCETQELNAVIFRDSFFTALQPYFSRQFHRSTYIWEQMNYTSLIKYVEEETPDIVIDEVVERLLPYTPDSTFFESIQ